jgi:HD-GYP domain-containing protein (c-di-GMP phosphodiesterase class II)
MDIDDVIRRMALSPNVDQDEAALREFTTATRRVDTDPGETERIRALAESVDADIVAYDQGLAALDHGDTDAAETLLLRAVTAELGDADGILAELLTQAPDSVAPLSLHQRAAEARAHRAILNAAYKRHGAEPSAWHALLRRLPPILRAERNVTADDLTAVLMTAMEAKDPYTRGHSERISALVVLIGQQVGMRPDRIEAARLGGLFHDIGKLAIPNTVLEKAEALTEEEYTLIMLHVTRGVDIVREMPEFFSRSPGRKTRQRLIEETLAGIQHHHERFDGRGYPLGLAGHEIPQIARAIAVADAFDAMTTTRNHQCRRSPQEALNEIRRCAGQYLDPEMVEAFLTVIDTNADQINQLTRHELLNTSERVDHDHDTSAAQQRTARAPMRGSDR